MLSAPASNTCFVIVHACATTSFICIKTSRRGGRYVSILDIDANNAIIAACTLSIDKRSMPRTKTHLKLIYITQAAGWLPVFFQKSVGTRRELHQFPGEIPKFCFLREFRPCRKTANLEMPELECNAVHNGFDRPNKLNATAMKYMSQYNRPPNNTSQNPTEQSAVRRSAGHEGRKSHKKNQRFNFILFAQNLAEEIGSHPLKQNNRRKHQEPFYSGWSTKTTKKLFS